MEDIEFNLPVSLLYIGTQFKFEPLIIVLFILLTVVPKLFKYVLLIVDKLTVFCNCSTIL